MEQFGPDTPFLCEPNSFNRLLWSSSDDDSSSSRDDPPTTARTKRSVYTQHDRMNSTFWRLYIAPAIDEDHPIYMDDSPIGKQFRRRFRVPYNMFLEIVKDMKNVHNYEDRAGVLPHYCIDWRLLVLGSLRAVASGCAFDLIEEATNVADETHRVFFHERFCEWGRAVKDSHINLPNDLQSLRQVTSVYERLGLPGCTGSVDCVHLLWDMCPAGLHSSCKGKDGHPTLAFEAVVSHTRRFLSVSRSFWGTVNDKTIARHDPAFKALRTAGTFLNDHEWGTIGDDLTPQRHKGAYFVCDGGYHRWTSCMNPFKHQLEGSETAYWSRHLESIRKDVECSFGILKKRFMILKHAIRFHDAGAIENLFITCCVIHNLLLEYDGLGDSGLSEEEIDVEYDVMEASAILVNDSRRGGPGVAGVRSEYRDLYNIDDAEDEADVDDEEDDHDEGEEEAYHRRRKALIDHLSVMRAARSINLGLR